MGNREDIKQKKKAQRNKMTKKQGVNKTKTEKENGKTEDTKGIKEKPSTY